VKPRPRNWVFLGDSLTEGVGSSRVSYVSELVSLLREAELQKPQRDRTVIHEFRLRRVDPDRFNQFIRVNTVGIWNAGASGPGATLWLWNFACEGTTTESDMDWMPLIENLRPERVFVFRGSLENVVRPAALADSHWPWWVPLSWRGYASMDPRCYFSTTWWRRAKQVAVDAAKQKVRLALLAQRGGYTLLDQSQFSRCSVELFAALRRVTERLHILGLLPIEASTFPGSAERFQQMNDFLRTAVRTAEADFIDWGCDMKARMKGRDCFYRDGFHPNLVGARVLADILHERLSQAVAP
jgi:hypothetical protein